MVGVEDLGIAFEYDGCVNLNGRGPGYENIAGFPSEMGGIFESRGYQTILGFVQVRWAG